MPRLGDDVLVLVLCLLCCPLRPRPHLGLLGVETPGDPACTGRLPAAVGQRSAEGWLGSPPPPLRGCRLAAPLCLPPPPPPGVEAPLLVAARRRCGLPTLCPFPAGGGPGAAAVPSCIEGKEAGEGAGAPLLAHCSGGGETGAPTAAT